MTYLQFHLVFLLPPLSWLLWRRVRRRPEAEPGSTGHVLLLGAIALAWTTPWDNYLVKHAIWSYGPGRVVGTLGYVPIEEYLFFLAQPLLVGMAYLELEPRWDRAPGEFRGARGWGALAWLTAAAAGAALLGHAHSRYLGLILVWAAPVLAAQWAWAGRAFMARRAPAAAAVGAASLYLWSADRVAIALGIWQISADATLGLDIVGLPIEEAVFFFLTNLLVVQGLILFRHPTRQSPSPGHNDP